MTRALAAVTPNRFAFILLDFFLSSTFFYSRSFSGTFLTVIAAHFPLAGFSLFTRRVREECRLVSIKNNRKKQCFLFSRLAAYCRPVRELRGRPGFRRSDKRLESTIRLDLNRIESERISVESRGRFPVCELAFSVFRAAFFRCT